MQLIVKLLLWLLFGREGDLVSFSCNKGTNTTTMYECLCDWKLNGDDEISLPSLLSLLFAKEKAKNVGDIAS